MDAKPNRFHVILAIVLAAGGAIYLWVINIAILRDGDRRKIDELQKELLATREALHQAAGDYAFLGDATLVPMKANDRVAAANKAVGIVLHRGATLFVAARNLPAPPKGKSFSLWAYFGGKPVSVGEFLPGPDGVLRGRHTYSRDLGSVEGFALSLEAAGGVDAPVGPMYLVRP